jgi:UDP-N-acetylmuramate--alanine ligase
MMPASTTSAGNAPNQSLQLDREIPVHFVGVGGVGMSGLAKILLESGFRVSGSDLGENAYTQELVAKGGTIYKGHAANQVPGKANAPKGVLMVVSSSIDDSNPEIAVAIEQGFPIVHRSTLLREILEGDLLGHEQPIGITGAHGKTTITGMTGVALRAAGLDPSIVVGGKIPGIGTNAVLGANRKLAVAELDESDGTLLQYRPAISVVANIELDHADFYTGGLPAFLDVFRQYIGALKPGSKVVYNVGCPNTKILADENPAHIEAILVAMEPVFTGKEPQPTYWVENISQTEIGCHQGDVYRQGKKLGTLKMGIPGAHNLLNGLLAIAVGDQLDADFNAMATALHGFKGMGRRFEPVGVAHLEAKQAETKAAAQALLIDDYAHHPTEVEATLKAARESLHGKPGRIIAIFQPHRYTRLKALWDEFCACFKDADVLFLADVYAAHEPVIAGITSESLAKNVTGLPASAVHYIPGGESRFDALRDAVKAEIRPGDIVLSMGAGSITKLLRQWEQTESSTESNGAKTDPQKSGNAKGAA